MVVVAMSSVARNVVVVKWLCVKLPVGGFRWGGVMVVSGPVVLVIVMLPRTEHCVTLDGQA